MFNNFRSVSNYQVSRALLIFALIFAGEMIFGLPFHIARFFRPTLLEVFNLSNADLGDIFAGYGVLAMLAYFPGGAIADRFSARKLLSLSLVATALGGIYMASVPGQTGLALLFAYWGITSILLFWAALIRATREWGGQLAQGRAFGLLDGGRGLVAALVATVAAWMLSLLLPSTIENIDDLQRRYALQVIILFYSAMTALAAVLVWLLLPETDDHNTKTAKPLPGMKYVLRQRVVWLQSAIVVCAYCAYKGLDNYGLYAVDALHMNEVEAAQFTSLAAYLRPIAAILAGLLADRLAASRIIGAMFLLLFVCYAWLAFVSPSPFVNHIIYANIVCSFFAVYALRGVYFALLEETKIANSLTGTAVGLISLIGFTPDIFFASIAGRLLDSAPGVEGHQHFFMMLTGIACVGLICTIVLTSTTSTTRHH